VLHYFYTTWGDNRLSDAFFTNLPDVRLRCALRSDRRPTHRRVLGPKPLVVVSRAIAA
jgi:hypothetical protein